MTPPDLDLLSRREFSRLVSLLTRRLGAHHLAVAEDAVQEAFGAAVRLWGTQTPPRNPSAWLYQTAWRRAIDHLRRESPNIAWDDWTADPATPSRDPLAETVDAELQLILLCCHPALTPDSQVALTLRVAAGFSVAEIARLLGAADDAIDQRLLRARRRLRSRADLVEYPNADLGRRGLVALDVVYAMFSEGYSSLSSPAGLRRELCAEALRLALALASHPDTGTSEAQAVVALFAFQASRLDSRFDDAGGFRSLRHQDRAGWDASLIALGFQHLAGSTGRSLSRFHLEAEIAACHAAARRYQDTDWGRIVELYDLLVERSEAPGLRLNRAIAIGERDGPTAGLTALLAAADAIGQTPLFSTAVADTLERMGDYDGARRRYREALALTPAPPIARVLEARLAALPG